jgi:hypothetical protein
MRFSRLFALILFVLIGCAKNSQDPEAGQSFNLTIGNSNCLDSLGSKLQNFFSGAGSQSDIHSVWACATKLLTDFSQYTEGASPDGYSAAELKGFLTKYYFPNGLSDDIIQSTLKLKQGIAGGSADFVARSEIQLLIQIIGVLDSATHDLFPFAKIVFTGTNTSASDSDWMGAYKSLSGALDRIGAAIVQSGPGYAFTDLTALLQAWAAQMNLPKDHLVYKIAGYVPVLGSAKAILIAGSTSGVGAGEWRPLFSALASIYSDYRMWLRLTVSGDYSDMLAAARLPWLAQGVVGLLNTAVERRPGKQIGLSEIHDLLSQLQAEGFFSPSLTADQLASAVQFLLDKVFTAAGAPADTLGEVTVSQMQSLLSNWNGYDAVLVSQNFSSTPEFGAAVKSSGQLLGLDAQGRLKLPLSGSGVFHEFSVIFAVLEWIGQKWGPWPVPQAAFDTAVSDWLNQLHSFGYLTGTAPSVSTSLMREANLFTIGCNGDLILDKAEAFQYALYALSSYRGTRALDAVSGSCNGNVACISTAWFNNRATVLANFPNSVKWLGNDSAKWATYSQDLGNVVGADQWLMQFMVIHFIETYLARFDSNGDQLINLNESLVAFPIFHPVLSIILPQHSLDETDVEPMYTYLFKNGGPPSGLAGDFAYLSWKNSPNSWSYNSDRLIMAGILSALMSY